MAGIRCSGDATTLDLDHWFDAWSEGPFTLDEVAEMVENGADPAKFHTTGWDCQKDEGCTFEEYLKQRDHELQSGFEE